MEDKQYTPIAFLPLTCDIVIELTLIAVVNSMEKHPINYYSYMHVHSNQCYIYVTTEVYIQANHKAGQLKCLFTTRQCD